MNSILIHLKKIGGNGFLGGAGLSSLTGLGTSGGLAGLSSLAGSGGLGGSNGGGSQLHLGYNGSGRSAGLNGGSAAAGYIQRALSNAGSGGNFGINGGAIDLTSGRPGMLGRMLGRPMEHLITTPLLATSAFLGSSPMRMIPGVGIAHQAVLRTSDMLG